MDATGVRGMKISSVAPGSTAEKAGLQPGDVIRSINDYVTQQPGNLEWIFVNAAPSNILRMNVLKASDNKEHRITAEVP